jgi:hypothetical protein
LEDFSQILNISVYCKKVKENGEKYIVHPQEAGLEPKIE